MTNLLLTLVLSLASIAPQPGSDIPRKSLAGISILGVFVDSLSPDALTDGLTRDQLKTDVELKLSLAGIDLSTKFDASLPYIYVQVAYFNRSDVEGRPIECTLGVNISFIQTATLFWNQEFMPVVTWNHSAIASGPRGKGRGLVQEQISDIMDKFINDYIAVNPKP